MVNNRRDLLREMEALRQGQNQDDFTPEDAAGLEPFVELCRSSPARAAMQYLAAQKKGKAAEERAREAVGQLDKLVEMIKEREQAPRILARLESAARRAKGEKLRVRCRINGQLHDIPVHPDLSEEELGRLRPLDFVTVDSHDLMVVGICKYEEVQSLAPRRLVEFKGYADRENHLVRVARSGHEEELVRLATPELQAATLTPTTMLVLDPFDQGLAVSEISAQQVESRFEADISKIRTGLDDLAGLDSLIAMLIRDVVLCVLRPDIRERFGLKPLRGMLISSYKPGQGKTTLMRALAKWLDDVGREMNFDVMLYVVKPGELKTVWHGGDAKLVRQDLCGAIRARQRLPRDKPLIQLVILDEIDSLGKRVGGDDARAVTSGAQNDAVQSLLAEMDGMDEWEDGGASPSCVIWVGLTNRPDMVDDALKRPGRLDVAMEIPVFDQDAATDVLAVHARGERIPWFVDDELHSGLSRAELRERILGPALAEVFPCVVLRYATEGRRDVEVSLGEILSGAHYEEAVNQARKKAATRALEEIGIPAITFDDIVDSLMDQASSAAAQMETDRSMMARQLRITTPVIRVECVPREEILGHEFLRH